MTLQQHSDLNASSTCIQIYIKTFDALEREAITTERYNGPV